MNLRLPELQLHLLPVIRITSQEICKIQVVPTQVITVFQEHSTGTMSRREDAVAMFLEAMVATVRLFGIGRHHVEAAEVAAVFVVPGDYGAGPLVEIDVSGFLGGVGEVAYGVFVGWVDVSDVAFLGGKRSAVGEVIGTDLALGLGPTCC